MIEFLLIFRWSCITQHFCMTPFRYGPYVTHQNKNIIYANLFKFSFLYILSSLCEIVLYNTSIFLFFRKSFILADNFICMYVYEFIYLFCFIFHISNLIGLAPFLLYKYMYVYIYSFECITKYHIFSCMEYLWFDSIIMHSWRMDS